MASLNPNGQGFVGGISYALKRKEPNEETIKTSPTASSLAIIYEAARNAVEFRSEHLIRQAAIVRILRRRLFLGQGSERLSRLLIRELIWARYLKEDSVAVSKVTEIQGKIDKYRLVLSMAKEPKLTEWILNLAGCEIEESLVFNPYPQLLINFVAQSLQRIIKIYGEDDPNIKDIQVYIAVERAFAKNSDIFISYHLLKALMPSWIEAPVDKVAELFPDLLEMKRKIDKDLNYPLATALKVQVTKLSAPFNVIREIVTRDPERFIKEVSNEESFDEWVKENLEKFYKENRSKMLRASTRSIIYIFLTKMVFALALELPFDLFLGRTDYLALVINLLFPPTLMFLLNARISIPDEENTERILAKINSYLYEDLPLSTIEVGKKLKAGGVFERIFMGIYTILFIAVFAFVVWILNLLHFNPVSQLVFLFFLSVVSFFAYKVRSISRDYVYEEEKEGFLSSLVDFFFLPVVRVGQWLSQQISRLNILGFVLDFIIEAPLKAFLEVVEEWARFVRVKKEEIFTEG